MAQRGQAAAAMCEVSKVLEEERKHKHFRDRQVTPEERKTRQMWNALADVTGPTYGSLQLTVGRAKVRFRMGSYKHLLSTMLVAAAFRRQYNIVLVISGDTKQCKTMLFTEQIGAIIGPNDGMDV